jgi:hypothetical protein
MELPMSALPALSSVLAADTPPKPTRAKSIQKNVSAASRTLQLVEDDKETSLSPSFLKEARWSCSVCGTRSIGPVHPLCGAKQLNGGQGVPKRGER